MIPKNTSWFLFLAAALQTRRKPFLQNKTSLPIVCTTIFSIKVELSLRSLGLRLKVQEYFKHLIMALNCDVYTSAMIKHTLLKTIITDGTLIFEILRHLFNVSLFNPFLWILNGKCFMSLSEYREIYTNLPLLLILSKIKVSKLITIPLKDNANIWIWINFNGSDYH